MPLSLKDKSELAQAVADALVPALLAAFASKPIASAPAQASEAQPVHIGPSGKPDGRRFPCTAEKPCGRLLRSAARAAVHADGEALRERGHRAA